MGRTSMVCNWEFLAMFPCEHYGCVCCRMMIGPQFLYTTFYGFDWCIFLLWFCKKRKKAWKFHENVSFLQLTQFSGSLINHISCPELAEIWPITKLNFQENIFQESLYKWHADNYMGGINEVQGSVGRFFGRSVQMEPISEWIIGPSLEIHETTPKNEAN